MPRTLADSLWLLVALPSALCLGVGCAGDLKDPSRFDAVLASFGDASVAGSSGRGGSGGSAGSAGSSGTGGSSGSGGTVAMPGDGGMTMMGAAPPMCVTQVFQMHCGMAGCHNNGSLVLDLVSPGVTARLTDKASKTATCKDRIFIDTNGGASLLIDKLDTAPPCGAKMPLITGMFSAADRTCLEAWVQELGGSI